ncbi:hypothetical protein J4211_00445 [Candidatus Woesearchaeota archaeon]|nr:hypothetical protein [Candidatus Woesearchaeota archaeon]
MRNVEWTKRELVPHLHEQNPDALFYDTSTNAPLAGDFDYVTDAREFSPFIPYGGIPVPGRRELSDSVEGVWQGLKIIKGSIDTAYFRGKGRKRKGQPSGHLYFDKVLSYIPARERIYVPTYTFMFNKRAPASLLHQILTLAGNNTQQYFFDVDKNQDIRNTSSPLSHAAVLVQLINQRLQIQTPQLESQPVDRFQAPE